MKVFSKILFALYLLLLIWLLLFKLSIKPLAYIEMTNLRSLNLIPYAASGGSAEILFNVLVFIPYGMLLCICVKKLSFTRKFLLIFITSFAVEIVQYILAIGASDITDLINNSIGGLIGLVIYAISRKIITDECKLDKLLTITVFLILLALLAWQLNFRLHSPQRT